MKENATLAPRRMLASAPVLPLVVHARGAWPETPIRVIVRPIGGNAQG